jgi:hypothetical protein
VIFQEKCDWIDEISNTYSRFLCINFRRKPRACWSAQALQTWRLLYSPPAPYTRERFQDTYGWMQGYPNLVAPGATYEEVVDNRAWQ